MNEDIKIVDLSADFRLKNAKDYVKWYGWEHPFPELLQKSVYGVPEFHRDEIKQAKLVSVLDVWQSHLSCTKTS